MTLHSDYHIRWKNFRGFDDTKSVRIAPLTIILGANNSGKSSLMAPLLLMRQTMSSRDTDTPLITRGKNIDAGFYRDYVHRHDFEKDISFSFRYHTHNEPKKKLKPVGAYAPGMFDAQFKHLGSGEDIALDSYVLSDIYQRQMLSLKRFEGRFAIEGPHFDQLTAPEREAIAKCEPINFIFSPTSALYTLQSAKRKKTKDPDGPSEVADYSEAFKAFLQCTSFSFEEIRSRIESIFHIGPHRHYPIRAYEYLGDKPSSVGKEGEYFASILKRDSASVLPKFNSWLKTLELGRSLEIKDLSGDMFSILLKGPQNDENNIADLGFGVSQVLPVIAQLLTAAKGSLTIIEQPELHLNPRLQGNLAELFVDAANNEKRVVVETHSEHLLMKIRTLVAEERIRAKDLVVYFVERTGKRSHVREIEIDQLGHIDPKAWPKDFFADGLDGALELARAQRKAISTSNG